MKARKFLAGILAMAMVLGTLYVPAFATEGVVEMPKEPELIENLQDIYLVEDETSSSVTDASSIGIELYSTAGSETELTDTVVAKIGTTEYTSLGEALTEAAATEDKTTIQLMAGEFSLGTVIFPATLKNVEILGAENKGTILKDTLLKSADGNDIAYTDITIDGIVFDNSQLLFTGWRSGNVTFGDWIINDCEFKNIDGTTSASPSVAAVHFNLSAEAAENMVNFTFTNNIIKDVTAATASGVHINAVNGDLLFENNSITNVAFNTLQIQHSNAESVLTIKDNVLNSLGTGTVNPSNYAGTINLKGNAFIAKSTSQYLMYNIKSQVDVTENFFGVGTSVEDAVWKESFASDNRLHTSGGEITAYYPTYTDADLTQVYPGPYVAKIDDVEYKTFLQALRAVESGETITLLEDAYVYNALPKKDITLDLGGNTLNGMIYYEGGELTIKNGTFRANPDGYALGIFGSKDVSYAEEDYTVVNIEEDATLESSTGYGIAVFPTRESTYWPVSYGMTLNIHGTVDAYSACFVSGNIGFDNYKDNVGNVELSLPDGISAPSAAMKQYGPVINVYGTIGDEDTEYAIYLPGYVTVNVYDGASITGQEAIGMKGGTVNVYGGTITSTGEKVDPVPAVNSGSEASGAAISVTSYYTNDLFDDAANISVNIEGGTIIGTNNAAVLVAHSYSNGNPSLYKQGVDLSISGGNLSGGGTQGTVWIAPKLEGDAETYPDKFISGGDFASDVTEYCVDGYVSVKRDGVFKVMELKDAAAAKIGEVYYLTIQDAIDAAESGATIDVLPGEHDNFVANKANIKIVGISDKDGNKPVIKTSYEESKIDSSSSWGTKGIIVSEQKLTLENLVIKSFNYGSGWMQGCSIVNNANTGSTMDGIEIKNCDFVVADGVGTPAIAAALHDATVTFTGNTVTGFNTGIITMCDNGTVENYNISNNKFNIGSGYVINAYWGAYDEAAQGKINIADNVITRTTDGPAYDMLIWDYQDNGGKIKDVTVKNNGEATVALQNANIKSVKKDVENTTYSYTTVDEALKELPDGEEFIVHAEAANPYKFTKVSDTELKLMADAERAEAVEIKVSLDLNGFTLTAPQINITGGNVTLTNGSVTGDIVLTDGKTLVINDIKHKGAITGENITINSGYFTSNVEAYCAEGLTTARSDIDGYTFKVVKEEEVVVPDVNTEIKVDTPTTDVSDEDVKEALGGESAKETIETAVKNNTNTNEALNTEATLLTKEEVIATEEEVNTAIADAEISVDDAEITVVVQPYMEVKAESVEKNEESGTVTSITYDVKAMYKAIATTATSADDIVLEGEGQNAVEIGEAKPLSMEGKAIELSLPVAGIVNTGTVYVKHTKEDGQVFVYPATVTSGVATFSNANGFTGSTFTISATDTSVATIEGVGYEKFEDAVNAAKDGDVIEVKTGTEFEINTTGERAFTIKNVTGSKIKVTITPAAEAGYRFANWDNESKTTENPLVLAIEDGEEATVPKAEFVINSSTPSAPRPNGNNNSNSNSNSNSGSGSNGGTSTGTVAKLPFTDVSNSDWFYEAVKSAYEKELMNGVSDTEFAPNDNLTRGMLVTILYRYEGSPAVNKSIPFADVNANDYYANAVNWAQQNGIVNGYSETEFAPNDNILREQIAAILYRYKKYKGEDVTAYKDILTFADGATVSEYAISAMQWACGAEIINGKGDGILDPGGNATRAELAQIFYNMSAE